MVFTAHTVYPAAINLLLQMEARGVKTVSKSLSEALQYAIDGPVT
jgi:hypothetical protein